MGDFNTTVQFGERIKNGVPILEENDDLADTMEQCQLTDASYNGVFLTWCNKQEGEARMYAKLDRIIVNNAWLQEFNWSSALFLNLGISDHAPGVLFTGSSCKRQQRRFKFCNFWVNGPQYPVIVRETWETFFSGIPMYKIVQKLKLLKLKLKYLHKSNYRNLVGRLNKAKSKLDEVQTRLRSSPANVILQKEETECYNKYTALAKAEIAKAEISLFQQRTKEE